MRWGNLASMARPSVLANGRRANKKGVAGNLKGEGRLLGGLLVVGKGEDGVALEHREKVRRRLTRRLLQMTCNSGEYYNDILR